MEPKLSHSLANFAFRFCNELDTSKTTICSPLAAEMLLAIVALGSKGQSRAELVRALDMADDDALRSSFSFVTSALQTIKEAKLSMANKVYVKKGGELKPGLKKDVEKSFQSNLEQLDFLETEVAARIINKWVAEKTNGLIKEVVSAQSFNQRTRLVLVNAVYFKGNWSEPFLEINTDNDSFHVNKSTTIKVPMMYNYKVEMKYRVISELKAKILEMDYEGAEASMVIVLPDDVEGLSGVLQRLVGGYDLMADVKSSRYTTVNVKIPKFKVETTIDLREVLPKLGINSILDESSSEIDMLTSGERLVVSEAVQKAFIVVDETGTEAAASTAMLMELCCARKEPPPQNFTADRPFLYLLMARGIPLFVGVYEGSQFAVITE